MVDVYGERFARCPLYFRMSRNFECFYRNYGYGTVTERYGQFPTHTTTALFLTLQDQSKEQVMIFAPQAS